MHTIHSLALAIVAGLAAGAAAADSTVVLPGSAPVPRGYVAIADYGSYRLYRGDAALAPAGAWELADARWLKFDRLRLDTSQAAIVAPAGFDSRPPDGAALQVVQFVGPVRDAWLAQLRATGALPIQYIDSDGYLVWADPAARSRLATLVGQGNVLQYSQPLPAFLKLGNSLFERLRGATGDPGKVAVIVQRYRHDDADGRVAIERIGLKPDDDWTAQLDYEIARFGATLAQVRQLIELPDVFWVGEYFKPTLNDEVQAQVIRGHLAADGSAPLEPGYLPWLQSLGFPADPQAYPILDITDDGVGDRTTATGDPTLHQFGDGRQASRMVYNQACTANNGIVDGHGHLNANIALGYDLRDNQATPGARFPGDYQRGQGMNPFGRLGATRVFAPVFDLSACPGSYAGVIAASYAAGARISSNSWGCGACAGQYDVSSQAYDAGTRDADPLAAGNQELITVFSAGNDGSAANTIGSPGNGKNMITVGASESVRPQDENGAWIDGCQIGQGGADNAMDVIFFSSRGPAPGGRVKPDLVAPGTHVTGTRADPGSGNGICDASRPIGNATYAASSGTSHSTPAVSGVASLSWWWLANGQGSLDFDGNAPSPPSPALMKAWLVAHPNYLTGVGANDSLPSNAQGFGMPDLEDLFGNTPTFIVNQTRILADSGETWTWRGESADPSKPLRVVLAWTDAPGAVGTSPQVNNLDLEVVAGANTFRGNHFDGQWSTPGGTPDGANNVEAVFLPPSGNGPVTIRVSGFNIAGDGVPGNAGPTDQDFAIVCSNCAAGPAYTLGVAPGAQAVCSATTASVALAVEATPILGFKTPLALGVGGQPGGTSSAFSVNPMPVPGTSMLNIGNLAAATAGTYQLAVSAEANGIRRTRYSRLDLFSASPAPFNLTTPATDASNVGLSPLLGWEPAVQASRYRIEIARDPTFADVVYTTETGATSHTVAIMLDHATRYYWRVSAINECGQTPSSATRSFTTKPVPGECAPGSSASAVYDADFEAGPAGWTSSGTHDTWALSSARSHSAAQSMLALDVPYDSDQRLVSPAITLPVGQLPLSLSFWSHQTLENRIGGCYDGAFLEISSDAGASWVQVSDSQLLTGDYDGPISSSFNNPARGKLAWCGDPRDWSRTIVDLDAHAGESVQFRFRVATDASTGRVPDGFYLDDVTVQGCSAPANLIFSDGFDAGAQPAAGD